MCRCTLILQDMIRTHGLRALCPALSRTVLRGRQYGSGTHGPQCLQLLVPRIVSWHKWYERRRRQNQQGFARVHACHQLQEMRDRARWCGHTRCMFCMSLGRFGPGTLRLHNFRMRWSLLHCRNDQRCTACTQSAQLRMCLSNKLHRWHPSSSYS